MQLYICTYAVIYIYIYAFSNRVTNIESFERIIRNWGSKLQEISDYYSLQKKNVEYKDL